LAPLGETCAPAGSLHVAEPQRSISRRSRNDPGLLVQTGGDDQGLQDAALIHRLSHLGDADLAAEIPRVKSDGVEWVSSMTSVAWDMAIPPVRGAPSVRRRGRLTPPWWNRQPRGPPAMRRAGLPDWLVDQRTAAFRSYRHAGRDGYAARVSDALAHVTGLPPRGLVSFVRDNRVDFT
jgi:hypothetical protein